MPEFSFKLEKRNMTSMGHNQYCERLKLNDEWTVQCFWEEKLPTCYTPQSIEFQRSSTVDEVAINGLFYGVSGSLINRDPTTPTQKFSNLMGSGCLFIVINLDCDIFHSRYTYGSLEVNVTITSITHLPTRELRKESLNAHLIGLSNDFGPLLDPQTCCLADVNLKCGDASIPAHKVILSVRSPVFAAMFKNPMKENRENEVVIGDVDEPVLRLMLKYVYTARLPDLTVSSASDLLFAADKYQLADLKRLCCEFLKDNIALENVLRILFLGELFSNDLKSFAIKFISDTCMELSVLEKTEEWKTLSKERPDLGMDILTSMVKAKEKQYKK